MHLVVRQVQRNHQRVQMRILYSASNVKPNSLLQRSYTAVVHVRSSLGHIPEGGGQEQPRLVFVTDPAQPCIIEDPLFVIPSDSQIVITIVREKGIAGSH